MKTRILKVSFLASLPFWVLVNVLADNLEEFFLWKFANSNPNIFTAQVSPVVKEADFYPRETAPPPEISAKAGLLILLPKQGVPKIIFEKNKEERLPIASLTKLMTADIVLEYFSLSQEIEISPKAISQDEKTGGFKVGEKFTAKDLLYPLLIESSNDAAYALAETITAEGFVMLMNLEANYLGLASTHFLNPTGLDPKDKSSLPSISTAEDLAGLTIHLLQKPLLWEILSKEEFDLYSEQGVFHHKLITTNELLRQNFSFEPFEIIGGKTGITPMSEGTFLLVLKEKNSGNYLINIILGSKDRFGDAKKLIDWLKAQ